jgi:metal-sulfur cluster biosynthetic enzyme
MNATGPDTEAVWGALAGILDPEFGLNIVDMGLVYSVEVADGDVHAVMTLTTPTCPSGGWIHHGAKSALEALPGVRAVRVELVFEPPWTPEMLSPEARRQLSGEG